MAQAKRIVPEPQAAPDTLPDDFMDWDGGSGTATLPVDGKGHDTAVAAPPVRERVQAPLKVMPSQRSIESIKEAPSRANEETDAEVDAFLKRLNEVNVSPVPARRQDSDEAPKSKPSAAPATGIAAVKQEPPKAAAQPASVEQELIDVFRSGYKEVGKKPHSEDQPKKKWGLIGGVAAGVVVLGLAVGIPLAVRGRNVSAARSVAAPTTTTITDEVSSAPKPSPSSPVSAVPAAKQNQQPNAEQQQATESDASANQASVSADMMNQQLNAGSQLPQGARQKASEVAPPPSGFGVAGMETSNDPSAIGGVFKSQSRTVIGPSSVKVSAGVAGGMLIRKTPPEYPTIAKTARVAGTVVLAATITKSGRVSNLQVISGPAMLRQAAMDAVRNWLYKPYLLNNQPTEVQTTINVDFNL